jgi:uncharacterized phage protein (TIGR01671 family)
MNREIKFRIWDIENKEMLKVQELDFEPTFYGGRIAIRLDQYNDYFDTEDMILMQYTGLHDKNGREIYEGDIIKYKDSRGKHIEKVIFDKGCFYAGIHNGSSTRVAPKLINTRISEVIGNIYDNPELLGGE